MGGRKDPRLEFLRRTAPGTPLREAIDRVVQLGRGGLILVADRTVAGPLVAAGFDLVKHFSVGLDHWSNCRRVCNHNTDTSKNPPRNMIFGAMRF